MNLFERLILRRLMNVTVEGGEGGGTTAGVDPAAQQQNSDAAQQQNLLNPGAQQQQGERDSSNSSKPPNSSRRPPLHSSKSFQKIATKKAGRNFTRSWGARKKLKTTVLSHRKAAMGHF